jgi:hypothetical protein
MRHPELNRSKEPRTMVIGVDDHPSPFEDLKYLMQYGQWLKDEDDE